MTLPVVLVGESAEGRGAKIPGTRPFDPHTRPGRRLASLLGVESVPDAFPCVTLINSWPGRTSHGGKYPRGLARENAAALWGTLPQGSRVLLVGSRTAAAFGANGSHFLGWTHLTLEGISRETAAVPHPGNRWWRDPVNATRGTRFLRAVGRT